MGLCASSPATAPGGNASLAALRKEEALKEKSKRDENKWRVEKKSFEADGTLVYDGNREYVQLRDMLDDPLGQKYLGKFVREHKCSHLFNSWVDIQEYKTIPTDDFRFYQGKRVYDKYLRANARLVVADQFNPQEREAIKKTLDKGKTEHHLCKADLYDKIHHRIFRDMVDRVFLPFKEAGLYQDYMDERRKVYNKVTTDDFEFLELLGAGGFGKVVRVRKKSTRSIFAMKVMDKLELMAEFRDDRDRVTIERDILMCCDFPFIIGLRYAFQDKTHCFLMLDLAEAGDLKKLIRANSGKLPLSAVRFFTAEIVLALHHLHQMDLVYRDLKPANVLVDHSGHIKLADMGLAGVYRRGDRDKVRAHEEAHMHAKEKSKEARRVSNALANVKMADMKGGVHDKPINKKIDAVNNMDKQLRTVDSASALAKHSAKRTSVVGTFGYKAPEMFDDDCVVYGYGPSVDYWSLGVMMFKMLTGKHPFRLDAIVRNPDREFDPNTIEVEALKDGIDYPENMNEPTREIIGGLLHMNVDERLGTGEAGFIKILNSEFFEVIDWVGLMMREVDPPHRPPQSSAFQKKNQAPPRWKDWDALRKHIFKQVDEQYKPPPLSKFEKELYHKNWNYVSPATVREELGLDNEYAEEFKKKTEELRKKKKKKEVVYEELKPMSAAESFKVDQGAGEDGEELDANALGAASVEDNLGELSARKD